MEKQRFTSKENLMILFQVDMIQAKLIREIVQFHGNKKQFIELFQAASTGSEYFELLRSNLVDIKMSMLNKIIKGHGIESVVTETGSPNEFYAIDYINMGDTYINTIYYRPDKKKFYVGDLEDITNIMRRLK